MEMEKKNLAIIILAIVLAASGIGNIILGIQLGIIEVAPPDLESLVIGVGSGPNDLDPTDSWDAASNNVLEQVVETLYTYDTREFVDTGEMPRIPWLAVAEPVWSGGDTIMTIDIRTGITFHDGTPMDAAAVAWNFNRFMYLMNHTEELPTDGRAVKVHSLYEFPDGRPVFESVVALDVDTVVFTLTAPYAPIVDAMCYISCGIMSPDSTPATSIIDLATGDIVGTGPYTYDYYITDAEVRFTKFEDYWGADVVEDEVMFDAMIYSVIDDPSALNYAMLAGDVDFVFGAMTDLLPAFRANPWIHVEEINVPGLVYQYLAFNTHQINLTWRMAMSYALNYTYIIEELLDGRAFRAYGCISPGYGPAFNHWLRDSDRSSLKTNGSAVHDLETARNIILTGLGGDARIVGLTATDNSSDTAWEVLGQSPVNCLAYYNYSYNTDNWFRTDLYAVLVDWYADIGIFLEDGGTDWGYFILRAYGYVPGGYDQLQIYFIGWGPDYLDPFNMIDPLYSNISVSNACQINDPQIMEWLSEALETTDEAARRQIYHDIQWRLFAELYVHAPAYHGFITAVHAADLYDVEYDVMGRWWALPVKRNLTWVPDIG